MSHHCLYCDGPIADPMTWTRLFFPSERSPLCKNCLEKLVPLTALHCVKCMRPLAEVAAEHQADDTCLDCLRWERDPEWKDTLEKNISLYAYNDFLKEMIARYKYRGDYELAKVFSLPLKKALAKLEFDDLVPIPLSPERFLERGFNQSEALAAVAGFETSSLLLRDHSEKQSKKTRKERIMTDNPFRLEGSPVEGKKVVLLDDIYTTGATLHQAAKALKAAGAGEIIAITVARG